MPSIFQFPLCFHQTKIWNDTLWLSSTQDEREPTSHCYLSSFIPPSVVKRREVIPARSYLTPSICLLLPTPLHSLLLLILLLILSSLHFTPPPPSMSLHLSFDLYPSPSLSLCLFPSFPVMAFPLSRWWRRVCIGLREHASGIIQPARMKDSWCSGVSVCVCVCRSRSGTDWKKGTWRDREKRKGGGGWRVQSVRQIDGAHQG